MLLLNNKKQLIGGSIGAGSAHHHHLETHIYQFILERTDVTAVEMNIESLGLTTLHKTPYKPKYHK